MSTPAGGHPLKAVLSIPLGGRTHALAHWISQVFSPPVCYLLSILGAANLLASAAAFAWAGLHLALTVLLPLAYLGRLVRCGLITDLEMNQRRQRIRPLLATLLLSLLSLALHWGAAAPRLLVLLAAVNVVSVLVFLGTTLHWKISAHATQAAGLVALLLFAVGEAALPFVALVPAVAWSRIHLGRHTPAQTAAGALLGGALSLAAFSWY